MVIGAGPVGLDAALAALDAGMDVTVLEAGDSVATNVRDWGHVQFFTPWDMLLSTRMATVLDREGWPGSSGSAPTGAEFVRTALEPLARSETLSGRIRYGARVVSVGRAGLLKHEEIGTAARGARPFRILVSGPAGEEWVEEAHVVLDCSGSWGNPNPLGPAGIPALGERGCGAISYRIPDVTSDPDLRGLRILVVGGGHSAMTAVRDLGHLARTDETTRVYWAVRGGEAALSVDPDDPLPLRSGLLRDVKALVEGEAPPVQCLRGVQVGSVEEVGDGVRVGLIGGRGESRGRDDSGVRDDSGGTGGSRGIEDFRANDEHRGPADSREAYPSGRADPSRNLAVDRIFGLTGSVGDREIYRQLQVHECYATQGPMKLAAALLAADGGADCLDQVSHGAGALANPEPDFYILGSKSYGRNNTFLLRVGYEQVSEVVASLEGRGGVAA